MQAREQIITFLLQLSDEKDKVIIGLQTKIAELEKQLIELKPKEQTDSKTAV